MTAPPSPAPPAALARPLRGALALLLLLAVGVRADDWPQYLGPSRSGTLATGFDEAAWPAGGLPAIRWRARAGNGIASPIVVGSRLYTMGALRPDASPEDGVSLDEMWSEAELGTPLPADSPYHHLLAAAAPTPASFPYHPVRTFAFCFDADRGDLHWARPVSGIEFAYKAEGLNAPRAAPLHLDGRVYFLTHAGSVACLDATDGRMIWQKHVTDPDLGSLRTPHFGKCGMGGAPFHADGRLFLAFPHDNNHSTIAALDPATGAVAWTRTLVTGFRVDLLGAAHAVIEGQPTIVVPGGHSTTGLDPGDGSVRWEFDAHAQWPEIGFDEAFHRPGNCVYWADQHPGRHPVIYGDYIVNRVFIWTGHRDQRTYCLRIVRGQPQLVWDKKDLSAWRGLYVHQGPLLFAMDYGHATSDRPPTHNLCREQTVYDTERYQCIDIPTGRRLWATNAFTLPTDAGQLAYNHFEPEHLVAGHQVVVLHMSRLGWGVYDDAGLHVRTIATGHSFWGFSPLVLARGGLYFQRLAAINRAPNSFGDQQYNLFCLELPPPAAAP